MNIYGKIKMRNPYGSVGLLYLGETVFILTLSNAANCVVKGEHIKDYREAYQTVSNNGLENIVEKFELNINPEETKNLFFYYARRIKKTTTSGNNAIESKTLLPATTDTTSSLQYDQTLSL